MLKLLGFLRSHTKIAFDPEIVLSTKNTKSVRILINGTVNYVPIDILPSSSIILSYHVYKTLCVGEEVNTVGLTEGA